MARDLIAMISTGRNMNGKKTRYEKVQTKNKKLEIDKRKRKMYDPKAWDTKRGKYGMTVLFEEGKVKK